jgi:hypothetical protein
VERLQASAGMSGNLRWYGIKFEMQAKNDLTLRSFDVHINDQESHRVRVLTRPGRVTQEGEWLSLCDTTVIGQGYGIGTTIPESECAPTFVLKDNYQTLYVTLVEDASLVLQGEGNHSQNVLFNTGDIRINAGIAVDYFDGETHPGFSFQGSILYTLDDASGECADKIGSALMIESVGERTCAWLALNMDRYGFVCSFFDQSTYCPVTCGVCDQL